MLPYSISFKSEVRILEAKLNIFAEHASKARILKQWEGYQDRSYISPAPVHHHVQGIVFDSDKP
jgi:hypothetical protein